MSDIKPKNEGGGVTIEQKFYKFKKNSNKKNDNVKPKSIIKKENSKIQCPKCRRSVTLLVNTFGISRIRYCPLCHKIIQREKLLKTK